MTVGTVMKAKAAGGALTPGHRGARPSPARRYGSRSLLSASAPPFMSSGAPPRMLLPMHIGAGAAASRAERQRRSPVRGVDRLARPTEADLSVTNHRLLRRKAKVGAAQTGVRSLQDSRHAIKRLAPQSAPWLGRVLPLCLVGSSAYHRTQVGNPWPRGQLRPPYSDARATATLWPKPAADVEATKRNR
jgi:hypothetical protein